MRGEPSWRCPARRRAAGGRQRAPSHRSTAAASSPPHRPSPRPLGRPGGFRPLVTCREQGSIHDHPEQRGLPPISPSPTAREMRVPTSGLCKKQMWVQEADVGARSSEGGSCTLNTARSGWRGRTRRQPQPPARMCPFASQDACVMRGPGRRYTFTLHAGRERWLGAKQHQGRVSGRRVGKPRCADASLSAHPWLCPGCHAGLGDAISSVQMPLSQFAGSGAWNPSWGELGWVWSVNVTPPVLLCLSAGGNRHGELELIQVTTFQPSAGICRFPQHG